MATNDPVLNWTPQQRKSAVEFLKLYTEKLENDMEDPAQGYGLPGVQAGVLHLMDMVFPTGLKYTVNSGPDRNPMDRVKTLLTAEEADQYEKERTGE